MHLAPSSTHMPPLPPGWAANRDPATGRTYYANPTAGQTSWEHPSSSPPPPPYPTPQSVPRPHVRPYELPREDIFPQEEFDYQFEQLYKAENINAVNHGEFEQVADQMLAITESNDAGKLDHCPVLAIQRCCRGGETFMLHAVARILSNKTRHTGTHVILISLNSETKYMEGESPYMAILSRIAYAWE